MSVEHLLGAFTSQTGSFNPRHKPGSCRNDSTHFTNEENRLSDIKRHAQAHEAWEGLGPG